MIRREREPHELYSHARRRSIYLACEELNATWDLIDVLRFDQLWTVGHDVQVIADHFNRNIDEIVLLIIDRANLGKIQPREGGVFGWLGLRSESGKTPENTVPDLSGGNGSKPTIKEETNDASRGSLEAADRNEWSC